MSYHTWHVYGYGICVDDIIRNTTVDRIGRLLALSPTYNEKMQEYLKECDIENPTVDDYNEYDEGCLKGIATILQEVIEEVEDIPLCAARDYDDCEYLVFEPMYPWAENEKVRELTEEKLKQIFEKYVSILTDQPIEIGFQEIENGG